MSRLANSLVAAAVALGVFGTTIIPASAACKKMGFLVNDYGKDGPTADAQLLLDKHIAAWADEQGIVEYSVGKKTVKCELFLDFIVFDEHTCTATATVCWGGSKQPKTQNAKAKKKSKSKTAKAKTKSTAKKKSAAKAPAKKSPVVKTVATKAEKIKPSQTGTVETSAIKRYVPDSKSEKAATSPEVPYAQDAKIRNSGDRGLSDSAPTASQAPASKTAAVASERAAADRAAAAAERAAAAAERAAAAAQLAAEAAKQAAAAGQTSRAAIVAPVEPSKTP